ncbi:uncharacterized protein LOC112088901 [Eutrema salsugineum]|uniref:uncharacterized protein LOC112088901 n=1 Tax=Eutrema salsugineum TaxID=72664 RepID=UPI000CED7A1E|nr:uncharacterized protein LOC112088901 [Eutrema salsugineum]
MNVQQPYPPPPYHQQFVPPQPPVQSNVIALTYYEAMRHLKDMNMELFGGRSDLVTADNWRKKLEKNFETMRYPEGYRRELAVQYVQDNTLIWWEGLVEGFRGCYELTWDDFKDELSREYFPPEAMDLMKSAFEDLRQGNLSVREYKEELNRLRRFSIKIFTQADLIRLFMKCLRLELKNCCSIRRYLSMVELVETAAIQEVGLEEELKKTKSIQARSSALHIQKTQKRTWIDMCFRCGRHGHLTKDFGAQGGKCGHFAKDCKIGFPNQQAPAVQYGPLPEPPAKRQAVGPLMYALTENERTEPIAGSISVGEAIAYTMFDTGATHSFVSPKLNKCWTFPRKFKPKLKANETAGTEQVKSIGVFEDVPVLQEGAELP